IQLGIFSDNEKIKSLQQKLNQLNIQTKSETIKVNGADKIRLITDEFKTEALAKEVLIKIKNAGITGIIKKTS
ncbi:MAG: SPOR domain-containing protein, partial [Candidatus Methylopumilus sp.]|nr:SPOR domain-containing protein [Candidatus Methylopumilus sp.]